MSGTEQTLEEVAETAERAEDAAQTAAVESVGAVIDADRAAQAASDAVQAAAIASNLANAQAAELVSQFGARLQAAEERANASWMTLQTILPRLEAAESRLSQAAELMAGLQPIQQAPLAEEVTAETVVVQEVNPDDAADLEEVATPPVARRKIRLL